MLPGVAFLPKHLAHSSASLSADHTGSILSDVMRLAGRSKYETADRF